MNADQLAPLILGPGSIPTPVIKSTNEGEDFLHF
jgi:hypothetical protein